MEVLLGDTAIGHALMTVIAFGLLLYIVNRFAYQPIMNMLEERRQTINNDLTAAEEAKFASQKTKQERQELLKTATAEANQTVADAKNQSLVLTRKMEAEAKDNIQRMQAQAKEQIASERQHALETMEETVSNVSIEVAEKIIQREVTEKDQRRLISDFIQRLEAEVEND